jgi:hypothetical protein
VRYTPKGKNDIGRITDNGVPIKPMLFSSRKIGSTSAVLGMSMTTRVSTRSALRSLNSVSASAYPAGMLTRRVITRAPTA